MTRLRVLYYQMCQKCKQQWWAFNLRRCPRCRCAQTTVLVDRERDKVPGVSK